MDTFSVAGVTPLPGLTASQLPPEEVEAAAEKFSAAPGAEILIIWAAGVTPPIV